MSERNRDLLDVSETADAIVVRFNEPKVLNDHKLEVIAQELFRLAVKLGARDMRLDFANVEYLQSSVLGKLVILQKERTAAGGRLVLFNINPVVQKVFTVTKMDKFFVIEPAPPEAAPGA